MSSGPIREFRRLLREFEQQTQLQANDCCGISVPQCQALLEIEHLDNSSLKQLSENLRLDVSTLSRTVDSLVNRGLVRRTPDPRDRRYLILSLTDNGQQICDQINTTGDRYYQQVFQAIPEEHHQEILRAFDLFVQAMRFVVGDEARGNSSQAR